MGGNLLLMVVFLAVVFGDFDVMGTILCPGKADSLLINDPDAVLPCAVSLQRFQSIARRDQKDPPGRALFRVNKPRRAADAIWANSFTSSRLNKRSLYLREKDRIR